MSVNTGYKKAELAEMNARLTAQAEALVAGLPSAPLRELALVCACSNCIDVPAYDLLIRMPPPNLTPDLIGQYFGGVAVVEGGTSVEDQFEARVVFTHVLAQLAEATLRDRPQERVYLRQHYSIEPEHWTRTLLKTGFHDALPEAERDRICAQLADIVFYAGASGSGRLCDALTYLGMLTDALPGVLEAVRQGPPRRQLRFWTTFVGWQVSSHPKGRTDPGFDLNVMLSSMPEAGIDAMCAALEHPETERMIESYAFAAQDPEWLLYLSRLLKWRENTVLATLWSTERER